MMSFYRILLLYLICFVNSKCLMMDKIGKYITACLKSYKIIKMNGTEFVLLVLTTCTNKISYLVQ
jgi:hypothetical protein